MRVLWVENHALFAATVRDEILGDHDVRVVSTAAEGLRVQEATPFDVILVDYDLDDGKGDALVRDLRARGDQTPIVAVSARTDGNARMLSAGADTVCSKSKFRHLGKALAQVAPLRPTAGAPHAATPGPSPRVIRFYSEQDAHGELSNFAPYPVHLDRKWWPTSEHYFQAQKFLDPQVRERIRAASTPLLSARLGRDRRQGLRRDWESVKVTTMRTVVEAKFRQHPDLAELLLSTGDATLIEHTENDTFWGDGGDGSGANMLGRILMDVRSRLLQDRSS